VFCITADHGNAEQMIDLETGNPHTAHTTSKRLIVSWLTLDRVPFIVTGEKGTLKVTEEHGALADVAPTILSIMGLPQPEEMGGKSLAKE
jgi:2,3-bisphosphoglycerate-independent phosphoglycerate mutase